MSEKYGELSSLGIMPKDVFTSLSHSPMMMGFLAFEEHPYKAKSWINANRIAIVAETNLFTIPLLLNA